MEWAGNLSDDTTGLVRIDVGKNELQLVGIHLNVDKEVHTTTV
jgi:hypothetical protein